MSPDGSVQASRGFSGGPTPTRTVPANASLTIYNDYLRAVGPGPGPGTQPFLQLRSTGSECTCAPPPDDGHASALTDGGAWLTSPTAAWHVPPHATTATAVLDLGWHFASMPSNFRAFFVQDTARSIALPTFVSVSAAPENPASNATPPAEQFAQIGSLELVNDDDGAMVTFQLLIEAASLVARYVRFEFGLSNSTATAVAKAGQQAVVVLAELEVYE